MFPWKPSLIAGFTLLVAACSAGPSTSGSSVTSAPPPTVAVAPAVSPSAVAGERVTGAVQSIAGDKVTLNGGQSFSVTSATRVSRIQPITVADLKPGQYLSITAKRQPDNTLLASIVNIFPASVGQIAPGQRPMDAGNLMTNAAIDQINGNIFTVTFPGGGARVQLAPDAKLGQIVVGSPSDLKQGQTISALVRDGVAQTVSVM